jgi:hypothetical protein
MKVNGVTACILHFRVFITRPSILPIVFPSNTNFTSQTYHAASNFNNFINQSVNNYLIPQCCNVSFTHLKVHRKRDHGLLHLDSKR